VSEKEVDLEKTKLEIEADRAIAKRKEQQLAEYTKQASISEISKHLKDDGTRVDKRKKDKQIKKYYRRVK
jgi:hypothetical protein